MVDFLVEDCVLDVADALLLVANVYADGALARLSGLETGGSDLEILGGERGERVLSRLLVTG